MKYHGHIMDRGTTSACAENTASRIPKYHMTWNYLRVRGEYCLAHCSMSFPMELPPRARRIQPVLPKNWFVQGTTSACAENTGLDHLANSIDRNYLRVRGEYQGHGILPGRWGNYLRVRGEYEVFQHRATNGEELPPRARRIRKNIPVHCHGLGTTSACAENTAAKNHFILFNRNYLRVRGEYRLALVTRQICRELPPRARRIRDTVMI